MADDWDLYAVVRSCTTTNKNSNNATSSNKTDNNNNNIKNETWHKSTENDENPLACLASLTFEQENDPFGFSSLLETNNTNNNLFEGLEEVFKPFQIPPPPDCGLDLAPNTPSPTTVVNSTNPHLDHTLAAGINGGNNNNTNSITPPHFNSSDMPALQVPPPPPQFHAQVVPLVPPFHPPMRPTKRKSQQKKTICLVTAGNLWSDMWAWRKYGQKPIKGSPYPRNYYRCSSSKGCSAKKQVERSIVEPTMFTVSYTGDHNHPRPANRSSLAGSTRSKFNPLIAPKPESNGVIYFPAQTLSPTTPLVTASAVLAHQDTTNNMDFDDKSGSQELAAERSGGENNRANNNGDDDDDDDEDNLLIPNRMAMYDEDIFLGLHGLGGGFCPSPSSSADTLSGNH